MNDEQILMKGGDEIDIEQYAKMHGGDIEMNNWEEKLNVKSVILTVGKSIYTGIINLKMVRKL